LQVQRGCLLVCACRAAPNHRSHTNRPSSTTGCTRGSCCAVHSARQGKPDRTAPAKRWGLLHPATPETSIWLAAPAVESINQWQKCLQSMALLPSINGTIAFNQWHYCLQQRRRRQAGRGQPRVIGFLKGRASREVLCKALYPCGQSTAMQLTVI
jgi:hypothetical protein